MRLIFKFGGSSLSTIEKIKKVAEFIKQTKTRKGLELIVVVSAMGKTTNTLEKLASRISDAKISCAYSSLLSVGENISNYLLWLQLEEIGVDSIGLTSKDIKICAQGSPTAGIITHIDKNIIERYLAQNKVVIVSGFQGENSINETITLGRGGSDTTAIALGHVFNANVKIYTDVQGFYTLNPNEYKSPRLLKSININSAIDLASINAKVLDYKCLCLANENKTALSVCESMQNIGTKVNYNMVENYSISGISTKNKILFVINKTKNSTFLQAAFQNYNFKTLFYYKNNHEIWATDAEHKIVKTICDANKQNLEIKTAAILVMSGSGFLIHKSLLKKVQKILFDNKINTYYFNLTQTNLTIVIKPNKIKKLENLLASSFNLIKEI